MRIFCPWPSTGRKLFFRAFFVRFIKNVVAIFLVEGLGDVSCIESSCNELYKTPIGPGCFIDLNVLQKVELFCGAYKKVCWAKSSVLLCLSKGLHFNFTAQRSSIALTGAVGIASAARVAALVCDACVFFQQYQDCSKSHPVRPRIVKSRRKQACCST